MSTFSSILTRCERLLLVDEEDMITEDPEHVSILLVIVMINHLLTSCITSLKRLQDACLRSCLHCQGHNSGRRP